MAKFKNYIRSYMHKRHGFDVAACWDCLMEALDERSLVDVEPLADGRAEHMTLRIGITPAEPGELHPFCEECGDCTRCNFEDRCWATADGKHVEPKPKGDR
jgi:hypothetical protein